MQYQLEGSGPVIVLIHGLFGDLDNLAGCARALREQGFQTLRLSLRNHGGNPPEATMSFPEMAEDLERLRRQLSISRWALLGHSLGGKVAMAYAQAHPEHCWGLLVADIAPGAYPRRHDTVFTALRQLEPATLNNRQQAQQQLAQAGIDLPTAAFLVKNLRPLEAGGFYWRLNLDAIIDAYPSLIDAIPEAPPYLGPVMFLKGGYSDYLQSRHRDDIQARFPEAQMKILLGAGHWLHAQKPVQFNRLAAEFFRAHHPHGDTQTAVV
ncbi:alpha/beta fold hydrolase [Ferrimonas gelatinilytica]|uniref:Alpha/beta fold hydrolase n=1 Tax=Ferrimonas gelatinilytica TaxID=1255257 RepID=A0ABP9RVH3_9GAMM